MRNKEIIMTKWIDSKEAFLWKLQYEPEILQDYQLYLDEGIYEDDDEEPYEFEIWIINYMEDQEFFNSPEYINEMARLAEKD